MCYAEQALHRKDTDTDTEDRTEKANEWITIQVPEGGPQRPVQCQLLEIAQDHCLSQVLNVRTRNDKTLDLLLTNFPSPVNRVKGMPPIGKADLNLNLNSLLVTRQMTLFHQGVRMGEKLVP